MSNALKAFVIGPIGDKDAEPASPQRISYEEGIQILEEVVLPACSAFGIEAIRADRIARTGEIPEQIFRQLRDVPIVIADLTGANPNVMYELGLRHTTGKLTIQLGERGRLPFDVSAIRTIMFKRTDAGLVEARKSLAQLLAAGLEGGGDPVTATRVWFETGVALNPADVDSTREDNFVDSDEPGFLEKLAESEDGLQSLPQAMETASSIMQEITRIVSEGSSKINSLNERGGKASDRLSLVNRVAVLLNDPASRLQIVAGEFAQSVARVEPGVLYLLEAIIGEHEGTAVAAEFIQSVRHLSMNARSSANSALEFKKVVIETGLASRSLKTVGRQLSLALDSLARTSAQVANWENKLDPKS